MSLSQVVKQRTIVVLQDPKKFGYQLNIDLARIVNYRDGAPHVQLMNNGDQDSCDFVIVSWIGVDDEGGKESKHVMFSVSVSSRCKWNLNLAGFIVSPSESTITKLESKYMYKGLVQQAGAALPKEVKDEFVQLYVTRAEDKQSDSDSESEED